MVPEGTADWQRWAELATSDERPNWDCNTEERGHLERYWVTYFKRSKELGPPKAMSIAKGKPITL